MNRTKIPPPEPVTCRVDGLTLRGMLHRPETMPAPGLVMGLHGLLGTRDSAKQTALAHACALAGLAYCRFDHRGCGASDGDLLSDALIDRRVADLAAMTDAVIHRLDHGARAVELFGSSMGGATAIAAAAVLRPAAIVTAAALADGGPLVAALNTADMRLPSGITPKQVGDFDLTGDAAKVNRLLVIHGDQDELVPAAHARRLHRAAKAPKQLLLLPGGDHRLSRPDHQRLFVAQALAWFKTYLGG